MAEDAIAGSEEGATVVALDGRAVGRRGAATRRRILDATASVLERGGLRDLREIGRAHV